LQGDCKDNFGETEEVADMQVELLATVKAQKKISNKWIAEETGLSESTISRILSRQTEPKFEDVVRIAIAMGVSLDALGDKLQVLTEQFSTQNEQIIGWKDQINSNNETIDQVGLKIESLSDTLGLTGTVTEEEITKIKVQFASLYESVKQNMSLSEEIIMTALVGAMKRATPEISAEIDALIGEYQRYVRETQGRAEELRGLIENGYDELLGKHVNDPAYQEIRDKITGWYEELGYLNGSMSESGWQWQQTVADFNSNEIDLGGNINEAKDKIGEIASIGQTAIADIAAARDAVLLEVDNAIAYATKYKPEDLELLWDIRAELEADYAAQETSIKNELNTIFESIQNSMINNVICKAFGAIPNSIHLPLPFFLCLHILVLLHCK
jgi:DNA-binding phage protein